MEPSWPYYAFLISWIECFIVLWLAVSIETQSTDVSTAFDNSTTAATTTEPDTESSTKTVVTFASIVMPTCPPPNNLHLLCDANVSEVLNCKDRAEILEICWNKTSDIYTNSSWNECRTSCDDVVDFLTNLGKLTPLTTQTTTESTSKVPAPVTSSVTSSKSTISDTTSSSTNTSSPSSEQTSSSAAAETTYKDTRSVSPPIVLSTQSGKKMTNDKEDELPPINYVYPIIGCIGILIEVVVLCYIFCLRKRRQAANKYRRASQESAIVQEEIVEAESTNPAQALCNGPGGLAVPDVIAEDQHIFRSYLNLRFIDDSSLEGTPEKIVYK